MNRKLLERGMKVYWHDPDGNYSSGEYEVVEDYDGEGDVVLISNGTSEAEVLPEELDLILVDKELEGEV